VTLGVGPSLPAFTRTPCSVPRDRPPRSSKLSDRMMVRRQMLSDHFRVSGDEGQVHLSLRKPRTGSTLAFLGRFEPAAANAWASLRRSMFVCRVEIRRPGSQPVGGSKSSPPRWESPAVARTSTTRRRLTSSRLDIERAAAQVEDQKRSRGPFLVQSVGPAPARGWAR